MKDFNSINENELDGALNDLFLDTFSQKEEEGVARFVMEQEYDVVIDSKKEAALLARLNGKQGGKNIFLWTFALLLITVTAIVVYTNRSADKKIVSVVPPRIANSVDSAASAPSKKTVYITSSMETYKAPEQNKLENGNPLIVTKTSFPGNPIPEAIVPETTVPLLPADAEQEKILPYFNKEGLAFFAKVKEQMLQHIVKIDDKFYAKTEPGVTMYKSREVIVSPFVMSDFPVTNLEYKTFLADLASQGRVEDLKKCLPKGEVWKEYGCIALSKNYFENESYNNFPVVNVGQEACMLYCEWLQEEVNQKLSEAGPVSKAKGGPKKKKIIVRLPYDYEWIYSADAAYSLIPNCDGYNTIYDPSEGLVDKGFYKRTSLISKRDERNLTRMDKLGDVNRFGMTESEMISIYKEAITYADSKKTGAEKLMDDNAMEACSLAGHVTELIKDKEEGMTVRGCCWQNKEVYLKMMDVYKKNGASPFVGFRVVILNAEKGKDKNPFWY